MFAGRRDNLHSYNSIIRRICGSLDPSSPRPFLHVACTLASLNAWQQLVYKGVGVLSYIPEISRSHCALA